MLFQDAIESSKQQHTNVAMNRRIRVRSMSKWDRQRATQRKNNTFLEEEEGGGTINGDSVLTRGGGRGGGREKGEEDGRKMEGGERS